MNAQEMVKLAADAIMESFKRRGQDAALHEIRIAAELAEVIISYKSGDGTKIVSYTIQVRQFEVA